MMMVRFDGAWLSLVERSVRDREVVSSNLIAPTIFLNKQKGKLFQFPFLFLKPQAYLHLKLNLLLK
jgi:hypothetical protein